MASRRRRLVFALVTVILMAAFLEVVSYAVTTLYLPRSPLSFTVYDPGHRIAAAEIDEYFRERDPTLGWPTRGVIGTEFYDADGTRPGPASDALGSPCVAAFGDSFVYGTDVDDAHAWTDVLATELGCGVENFGVPGYGTDQAFLRYREHGASATEFVILGVATVDILRMVNQDRRLVWEPHAGLRLKPRFLVGSDGGLELVPLPPVAPEDVPDYVRHPERYLAHEWFLPGSAWGPVRLRFPYTLALCRSLLHVRVMSRLRGEPSWLPFYEPDHPSRALPVLGRVVDEFVAVARSRGQRPVVLIIPTGSHVPYRARTGQDPVAPFAAVLEERGVTHMDLTPALLEYLGERNACEIFAGGVGRFCAGHYNDEGSRVIAETVATWLETLRTEQP